MLIVAFLCLIDGISSLTIISFAGSDLLREAPDGYECTGMTGSRRWMAPEVCRCKLYGLSSDVYSYSLLFFHVMTLELPYNKYDLNKHMKYVVLGGERPNGKKIKTSAKLRDTIIQGWNDDPYKRPSMSTISDVIQEAVVHRKQDIKKNKRRSTVAHILRRSQLLNERSQLSMVGEEKRLMARNSPSKYMTKIGEGRPDQYASERVGEGHQSYIMVPSLPVFSMLAVPVGSVI